MDATASFYSRPTGISHYYSGSRRQVGGGIFGSLSRFILPKLKEFGKSAAERVLDTAANVASDVIEGGNVGDVLKSRGKEFLKDSFVDGISHLRSRKRPLLAATSTGGPVKRLRRGFKQKKGIKRRRQKGRGLF